MGSVFTWKENNKRCRQTAQSYPIPGLLKLTIQLHGVVCIIIIIKCDGLLHAARPLLQLFGSSGTSTLVEGVDGKWEWRVVVERVEDWGGDKNHLEVWGTGMLICDKGTTNILWPLHNFATSPWVHLDLHQPKRGLLRGKTTKVLLL